MFSYMEAQQPTVMVKDNDEGVQRVISDGGRYAFLMESSSLQYYTSKDCQLVQLGGLLDSKSYGVALARGG